MIKQSLSKSVGLLSLMVCAMVGGGTGVMARPYVGMEVKSTYIAHHEECEGTESSCPERDTVSRAYVGVRHTPEAAENLEMTFEVGTNRNEDFEHQTTDIMASVDYGVSDSLVLGAELVYTLSENDPTRRSITARAEYSF